MFEIPSLSAVLQKATKDERPDKESLTGEGFAPDFEDIYTKLFEASTFLLNIYLQWLFYSAERDSLSLRLEKEQEGTDEYLRLSYSYSLIEQLCEDIHLVYKTSIVNEVRTGGAADGKYNLLMLEGGIVATEEVEELEYVDDEPEAVSQPDSVPGSKPTPYDEFLTPEVQKSIDYKACIYYWPSVVDLKSH